MLAIKTVNESVNLLEGNNSKSPSNFLSLDKPVWMMGVNWLVPSNYSWKVKNKTRWVWPVGLWSKLETILIFLDFSAHIERLDKVNASLQMFNDIIQTFLIFPLKTFL